MESEERHGLESLREELEGIKSQTKFLDKMLSRTMRTMRDAANVANAKVQLAEGCGLFSDGSFFWTVGYGADHYRRYCLDVDCSTVARVENRGEAYVASMMSGWFGEDEYVFASVDPEKCKRWVEEQVRPYLRKGVQTITIGRDPAHVDSVAPKVAPNPDTPARRTVSVLVTQEDTPHLDHVPESINCAFNCRINGVDVQFSGILKPGSAAEKES